MTDTTRTDTLSILKAARDRIAASWTQGALYQQGAVCAMGALIIGKDPSLDPGIPEKDGPTDTWGQPIMPFRWSASEGVTEDSNGAEEAVKAVFEAIPRQFKLRAYPRSSWAEEERLSYIEGHDHNKRVGVIEDYNDEDFRTKRTMVKLFDNAIAKVEAA